MRNRSKLLLSGLAAALALGALVGVASAHRIGIKNTNTQWRSTWNILRFIAGTMDIDCHVTMEGSFHSRTLPKVLEALIGYVSRVTVDSSNCTGGSARALTETLPWHIRYAGFEGTLPKIRAIDLRLVGAAIRVQIEIGGTPIPCLYTSSAASPMLTFVTINTTTGVAESITPELAAIPKTSGGGLCPASSEWLNISTSLTQGATATKITLTLVE